MDVKKLAPLVNTVFSRLLEPSTWAGIAVLVAVFGVNENTLDKMMANTQNAVIAASLILAIVFPEAGFKALKAAMKSAGKDEGEDPTLAEIARTEPRSAAEADFDPLNPRG